MIMRSWIARMILAAFGWRAGDGPPTNKKYVMIAAPHTSSWDVPLLVLFAWLFNMRVRWMMKSEMFRGLRGPFFRALGGLPIDRSQRHNVVQQCIDILKQSDEMVVVVPPEGTRAAARGWKTGFYYIALGAGVPIAPGYLDFATKRGGFGPNLMPSGDIDADMAILADFYKDKFGKYPERFGEVRVDRGEKSEVRSQESE
jgi:1-acyl-sn-glycerol-3-phosphate acyltransferase